MEEQEKKEFFPIEFTKCPVCGCTETLAQKASEKEKEAGIIEKDARVKAGQAVMPLLGKKPPVGLTTRVLLSSYDFCAECGACYCIKAEIRSVPISVQTPQMPGMQGRGFPGSFPPGAIQGFG